MNVREICIDDLELICHHRDAMFRDAGRDELTLKSMGEHFRTWLAPKIRSGSYRGFLLSNDDAVIAGIGFMLIDWPPHPSHPTQDKRGYVLNLYVEPLYRRRGIARELMNLVDTWFIENGIQYQILHSTEKGRNLYSSLGWTDTTEMAKKAAK